MKTAVIIPVAGTGRRFGGEIPKQYLPLAGKPVIFHTVRVFLESGIIDAGVVVVAADELYQAGMILGAIPGFKEKFSIVAGGKQRQDSVARGLDALPNGFDILVVHDGVRPNISTKLIRESIECATNYGACVVAVPVKDTIKKVSKGEILETLNRDELWQMQTPQAFKADVLKQAHARAKVENYYGTDEAALVEWSGHKVQVVMGSYGNLKITTPEDLLLIEILLNKELAGENRIWV